jgi:hypothetical protein
MQHTIKFTVGSLLAAGTLFAGSAHAAFEITEAFTGLSGEDGTTDWFEVTNTGPGVLDTGSLFYDDDGPSAASGGTLDSILLNAGQSAIFLISDDNAASDDITYTSAILEFQDIWNYAGPIGLTNGGGGLGQGGDSVNLSSDGGTTFTETVLTPSGLSGALETIEFDAAGNASASALGVNGAYASDAFFNDNLGLPNDSATLVGSPGVVPEPSSLALLSLGGLAMLRRRRG